MQTAAKSDLVLTPFSSLNRRLGIQPATARLELNQQITQALTRHIQRRQSLDQLAERLISVADMAYPLRQMETVEQATDILLGLPLRREYKSVASYYKAFCLKRRGQFIEARTRLERVVDEATPKYKARALISLGTLAFDSGDFESSIPFYIEGSRAIIRAKELDPLAVFYTQLAFAIIKSINGDHKGALSDLEGMSPLVRAVGASYPPLYYSHLNSLAVELLEAGRIVEARNASNIVLASPFASAYPEYRETGTEIALRGRDASRSVVSFAQPDVPAPNVLRLPTAEHANTDTSAIGPPGQKVIGQGEALPARREPARVGRGVRERSGDVQEKNRRAEQARG